MDNIIFENKKEYKHAGDVVKDYRILKKISQKELSEKSGVSRGYICDLETKRKDNAFPSSKTIEALAKVLTETEKEREDFISKILSLEYPWILSQKIDLPKSENIREIKIVGELNVENKMLNFKEVLDTLIEKSSEERKNIFGIKISDCSLEPIIEKNSIILIDQDIKDWDRIKEKIALVSYKGKMYIRKVFLYNNGTIIFLKSLNPNIEEIIIPSEDIGNFKIYGKVIKSITEKIF